MEITFFKYQGTGNDFIMVDNRGLTFPKNDTSLIARWCDRRFGIGADGLILLENDDSSDFKMVYYNSDGNQSTMCGNGGRCIVAFANRLGIIKDKTTFMAVDGLHKATISGATVSLRMKDVDEIKTGTDYFFADTGSPHHVIVVDDCQAIDVRAQGSAVRYGGLYGEAGANVNFVTPLSADRFKVRTYERGVEDETLSCGTGVTAVALCMYQSGKTLAKRVWLEVEGGELEVSFTPKQAGFTHVYLSGPAEFVFKGVISA